jgi:hypothetical protein
VLERDAEKIKQARRELATETLIAWKQFRKRAEELEP